MSARRGSNPGSAAPRILDGSPDQSWSLVGRTVSPGEIIARILAGGEVKAESLVALQHALAVADLDGVGGTLVIKIPRKPGAPIDATFTTGSVSMRVEP
jgi:hypothetical protein